MIPLDKDRILLESFALVFAACDDDVLGFKGDDLDFQCFVHFHFLLFPSLVSICQSASFCVVVISRSGCIGCCRAVGVLIEELSQIRESGNRNSHIITIAGRNNDCMGCSELRGTETRDLDLILRAIYFGYRACISVDRRRNSTFEGCLREYIYADRVVRFKEHTKGDLLDIIIDSSDDTRRSLR